MKLVKCKIVVSIAAVAILTGCTSSGTSTSSTPSINSYASNDSSIQTHSESLAMYRTVGSSTNDLNQSDGVSQADQESLVWIQSFERALEESAATGKPILADFTGSDWCPPCIRLKKNVFDSSSFKSWAQDRVILLELDFPKNKPQSEELRAQNQQLARRYEIKGYPTVVFLDASGAPLGRLGYSPNAEDWLGKADRFLR